MPRRNQTNTNSVINEEGNEPKRNIITFNYSESFNRIIELIQKIIRVGLEKFYNFCQLIN